MNLNNAIPNADGFDGFGEGDAAPDYTPIPAAIYIARIVQGEPTSTRAGAAAYRLRFEVTEGPHAGKSVIRTWTFGEKARKYTQRDLAPFGLTNSAKLRSPFPPAGKEYHCRLTVALQSGTDGREFNDIKRIEILRVIESPAAAFMLTDENEGVVPK